jgi:hypothetical protein
MADESVHRVDRSPPIPPHVGDGDVDTERVESGGEAQSVLRGWKVDRPRDERAAVHRLGSFRAHCRKAVDARSRQPRLDAGQG